MTGLPPDPVAAELRATYGRVAYTHKTHEKEAERQSRRARKLSLANLLVITLTAGAALTAPLINSRAAAWIAAGSALLAWVFAATQLSFNPGARAVSQRESAKAFLALRDDYARLLADAQAGLPPGEILSRREILAARLAATVGAAPQTSPAAYKSAREALKEGEELTFTNAEIDLLLPPGI